MSAPTTAEDVAQAACVWGKTKKDITVACREGDPHQRARAIRVHRKSEDRLAHKVEKFSNPAPDQVES